MTQPQGRIIRRREPALRRVTFPEIGAIKIGEKRRTSGGKEYPSSLDYFRATGKYEAMFLDAYGPKPQSLEILFFSDEPSQSCEEFYELRSRDTGDRWGYGDGKTFMCFNPKSGDMEPVDADAFPDVMDQMARAANGEWKVTLTLRFLLTKLRGVAGHWKLRTQAEASSIPNLIGTIDMVRENAGTIQMIPFDLHVEKVSSQKPRKGDQPRSKFPVMRLVPNVARESLLLLSQYIESGHALTELGGMLTEQVITERVPLALSAAATPRPSATIAESRTSLTDDPANAGDLFDTTNE